MPHEEPELKWSLTQAFEDFANFDIDDEKLAGRISQENSSFFRAFRDTDRLKVVKYAKLMQFDNHTVLFADLLVNARAHPTKMIERTMNLPYLYTLCLCG